MADLQFTTPNPILLDVRIASGNIEVETVDGDQSTVFLDGPEKLIEETTVEFSGDRLLIERRKHALGFVFNLDRGLMIRVSVPHRSRVMISTASADARLDGSFDTLDYKAASGDLTLTGELHGDARIKTASGDVRLPHVGGQVSAQSVSGDIEAEAVDGSLDARSVSGDVRIRLVRDGNIKVNSVSGDVALGIARGTGVDVDANSTSGELTSDLPLFGEPVEGDGPTVVIRGHTVSGDFRLYRAA